MDVLCIFEIETLSLVVANARNYYFTSNDSAGISLWRRKLKMTEPSYLFF